MNNINEVVNQRGRFLSDIIGFNKPATEADLLATEKEPEVCKEGILPRCILEHDYWYTDNDAPE